MPLYEYRCGECGRLTEKIQKFSDPELTVCPYCSGPLARTLTAAAVHFSGGGWYKDLYSSAKPPAVNGGEKPGSAGEGAGEKSGEKTGNTATPTASTSDSGGGTSAPSPAPATASTPAPAASKE